MNRRNGNQTKANRRGYGSMLLTALLSAGAALTLRRTCERTIAADAADESDLRQILDRLAVGAENINHHLGVITAIVRSPR